MGGGGGFDNDFGICIFKSYQIQNFRFVQIQISCEQYFICASNGGSFYEKVDSVEGKEENAGLQQFFFSHRVVKGLLS